MSEIDQPKRKYYLEGDSPENAEEFDCIYELEDILGGSSDFFEYYDMDHRTIVHVIEEDGSVSDYVWTSEAVVEHRIRKL